MTTALMIFCLYHSPPFVIFKTRVKFLPESVSSELQSQLPKLMAVCLNFQRILSWLAIGKNRRRIPATKSVVQIK